MKIGLIGGMSYLATSSYYNAISCKVNAQLGLLYSPDIVVRSLNFGEIRDLVQDGNWYEVGRQLMLVADELCTVQPRCDYIAMPCCITHRVANKLESLIEGTYKCKFVHIMDPVGLACKADGYERVAVIGTKEIMEGDFVAERLRRYDVDAVMPFSDEEIWMIDKIITDELYKGIVLPDSARRCTEFLNDLASSGIVDAAVIMTPELGLLIDRGAVRLPILNAADYHIQALADLYLAEYV